VEISTQSEAVAVTPGAVPELRLLTSGVDAWRACLDVLFDGVHFFTGDDFQASLTVRHLVRFSSAGVLRAVLGFLVARG